MSECEYESMRRVEWPASQICANCKNGVFKHEDNNPCLYYCKLNNHPNECGKCDDYDPVTYDYDNDDFPNCYIEELYSLSKLIIEKRDYDTGFLSDNQLKKLKTNLECIISQINKID